MIVGAGPAGAALSLLLARRDIDVTLVEREPDFGRVFRGEALMPSGLAALYQLGMREALERLPHVVVPCMELYIEGARIVRADWPELSGNNAAIAISQPALIDLLVQEAAATGHFELRTGTALRAIDTAAAHVRVIIRAGDRDSTLTADAVIGGDGRASTVRALAGIELQRIDFPTNAAWLSLPAPDTQGIDPRFQAFSRGAELIVLYPSWDGRLRVGLNIARAAGDHSKTRLLETIASTAGEPYATIARSQAAAIPEPVIFKVLAGHAQRWCGDRLLLIGDAAHPMAPVRAQGINLALRDAIVAANHLVPALDTGSGEAITAAAARVQQEREPEVVAIQQLQLAAMQLPLPLRSTLLRRTLVPILRRTGAMKKMILQSEMPLRHGIANVRIAV